MKKLAFLICILSCGGREMVAQKALFTEGDRVCFIGNSITMNGKYHNYIQLYYATRYPDQNIRFYNCGISGDNTTGILRRLEEDVLIHQPTWSVVMAGMNDVNRGLYTKAREREEGIEQKRAAALETYFKNMDSLVSRLLRAGSKVVLQTPSPYDQTGELPSDNAVGVNDALGKCAQFLRKLAQKYRLPMVDYWGVMTRINTRLQKRNPRTTLIGNDRVHPGVEGHFVMAATFLKSAQQSALVSSIVLPLNKKSSVALGGSKVDDLLVGQDQVSFAAKEGALPYPRLSPLFNPDSLLPFTEDFNQERLVVQGLKAGRYALCIDSLTIGIFTSRELHQGINLARYAMTPQHQQAEKLLGVFNQYWELERKRRQVKYVEYQLLSGAGKEYKQIDEGSKARFAQRLESFKQQAPEYVEYYQRNFEDYMRNKPLEEELAKQSEALWKKLAKMRQPVRHLYQLIRVQ